MTDVTVGHASGYSGRGGRCGPAQRRAAMRASPPPNSFQGTCVVPLHFDNLGVDHRHLMDHTRKRAGHGRLPCLGLVDQSTKPFLEERHFDAWANHGRL